MLICDWVEAHGIDKEPADRWIEDISAKPEQKSTFAITSGTSTGLEVTYDLRYDGSKNVQVIIVHVNPMVESGYRGGPLTPSAGVLSQIAARSQ
ncbi:hypothetical protein [Paenarthrobacter sp. YJN-5]|uniref:hypothetical protein n=1 Tax=Paenarthrobacter sp. YJN-5 TaxID=2735316 RepID=UPI001878772A|nr:hypothetical protein [Paenarthrobacter sp. YJN-5]QOT19368.1 hypothetical protein HMI59_22195 [Paenarthrobacter sp. YJN-5]